MSEKLLNNQAENVSRMFDNWAKAKRDTGMEEGHRHAVLQALQKISFPEILNFLDIGCGNGWMSRLIASQTKFELGVGLDVSAKMIKKARQKTKFPNLHFFHTEFLSWRTNYHFNLIVSMEAFYYVTPMERIFNRLIDLMLTGGILLVGVDCYTENPESADWEKILGLKLDRRSIAQWRGIFETYGFKILWQKLIKYPEVGDFADWKRNFGSLFTCGTII